VEPPHVIKANQFNCSTSRPFRSFRLVVIFLYLLPTLISSLLSNDEEKEKPRFRPGAFDRDITDIIQPVVLGLEGWAD